MWDNFHKLAKEKDQAEVERDDANNRADYVAEQYHKMEKERDATTASREELHKMEKERDAAIACLDGLKKEIRELQKQINTKKTSPAKNLLTHLQKEGVLKKIEPYIMYFLFRNIRFVKAGAQLRAACDRVFKGIYVSASLENEKDQNGKKLDEQSLFDIYGPAVLTHIGKKRQYVQTRAQEAAKSKCIWQNLARFGSICCT